MRKDMGLSARSVVYLFYFISYCALLEYLNYYTHTDFQSVATGTKPLFRWIPDTTPINSWLSFINPAMMVVLTVAMPFVYLLWARIVFFAALFLVFGFMFQYVNGHSGHYYIWVSLFFCLIPGDIRIREPDDLELKGFLRVAQIQIFVIYGLAGVWKALSVIQSLFDRSIAAGSDYVPYAMASEFLYSNKQTAAPTWIVEHPIICLILSWLFFFQGFILYGVCYWPFSTSALF